VKASAAGLLESCHRHAPRALLAQTERMVAAMRGGDLVLAPALAHLYEAQPEAAALFAPHVDWILDMFDGRSAPPRPPRTARPGPDRPKLARPGTKNPDIPARPSPARWRAAPQTCHRRTASRALLGGPAGPASGAAPAHPRRPVRPYLHPSRLRPPPRLPPTRGPGRPARRFAGVRGYSAAEAAAHRPAIAQLLRNMARNNPLASPPPANTLPPCTLLT
jgi:hypothetical protein